MRRGLASTLSDAAVEGAPTTESAVVEVSVVVGDGSGVGNSAPISQSVAIRGPGDVVGLSPGQIVRTDPVGGVLDFEPNYFAAIELITPDLPWMFTPAAPGSDDKLVPWLALVVVRDDGSNRIVTRSGALLPVLSVASAADELPSLSEAWAWAHVQSTADLASTSVTDAWSDAPEDFLARLVCPRRLDPETGYIAALVPTFEAGRRAGLGLPAPSDADTAQAGWWQAWTDGTGAIDLPVYHSWTFRTGEAGDFEELVKRLTPRELDAGMRDFDIGDQGTDRLPPKPPAPKLMSWKGALVSPAAEERKRDEHHWDELRTQMRPIVQDGLREAREPGAGHDYDPLVHDPVVGPPAYGSLAAEQDLLPRPVLQGETPDAGHEPLWFGQANLDPDHRSASGLGAEVVRRNQESLMADAWNQAASLTEINRVLNWTRLAAEIGEIQRQTITRLSDAAVVQSAAPAAARLRVEEGLTVSGRLRGTSMPTALTSAAFRRICRPEGPVGRARRGVGAAQANAATAITRACIDDLRGVLAHTALIRPVGLQIGAETLMVGFPTSGDPSATRGAARGARRPAGGAGAADPGAVGAQPRRVELVRDRGDLEGVTIAEMPAVFVAGTAWTPVEMRKVAYSVEVEGQAELAAAAGEIRSALRPRATLSAKLADRIQAPGRPFRNDQVPAALSATPTFTEALYEKVRAIDPELLLPGVGAIPDDTVGLCYVNAAFVEAFLLGANDELAREFLWREYPAQLSDTWLRTFWDSIPTSDQDPSDEVEDIGPVAGWSRGKEGPKSVLGAHQIGFGAEGTLVLVIKGELLRKYPDTVVYATKAVWNEKRAGSDGETVPANTLREEDVGGGGGPAERKDPLFAGALDRDTVFLGFDLKAEDALGPVDADGLPIPGGNKGDRDGGWFFVFEEAPTGPRFGLDIGRRGQANRLPKFWRNASWYHQVEDPDALTGLSHAEATGRLSGRNRRWYDDPDSEGGGQFKEAWGTDAAAMARVTFQRPVRMLVHASAMLPEEGADGDGPSKPAPPKTRKP
jgi:hypothetical protein